MDEKTRQVLRDLFKAAQPEFGKRFTALLTEYIEKCETETERHLIENVIRNKIDRESKNAFFRIIRRLLVQFL
mgnify:CR=1 FL=1